MLSKKVQAVNPGRREYRVISIYYKTHPVIKWARSIGFPYLLDYPLWFLSSTPIVGSCIDD